MRVLLCSWSRIRGKNLDRRLTVVDGYGISGALSAGHGTAFLIFVLLIPEFLLVQAEQKVLQRALDTRLG